MKQKKIYLLRSKNIDFKALPELIVWHDDEEKARKTACESEDPLAREWDGVSPVAYSEWPPYQDRDKVECKELERDVDYSVMPDAESEIAIHIKLKTGELCFLSDSSRSHKLQGESSNVLDKVKEKLERKYEK